MTTPTLAAVTFPLHTLDDQPVAAIVRSSTTRWGIHGRHHGVVTVVDRDVAVFSTPPAGLSGRWLMVCEAHGQAVATPHIQRYTSEGGKAVRWDDADSRLAYRTDATATVKWCPDCA